MAVMNIPNIPVVKAIDHVTSLCQASQDQQPDEAVALEIRLLNALRTQVEAHWPLPAEAKQQLAVGAIAAKNIDDWNPDLAHALMSLEYAVRHDGEALDAVFASPILREAVA